jgi:hypothetical protein
MAEGLSTPVGLASQSAERTNKYARVMAEAMAKKATRQNLGDDRRIMPRRAPPNWAANPEET